MKSKATKPTIEIDLAKIEALASRGLTNAQISQNLGISERTLYNRKSQSAEIAEAIKRGQSKGIAEISNALYESAKKGNVTAQIFFLCNRARDDWKNVNKVEQTTQLEIKEVKDYTEEELDQALRKKGLPTAFLEE